MVISYYKSAKDAASKETIVFEQYLQNIKNGAYQDAVIEIRRMRQRWKAGQATKEDYQKAKTKVPAVTASGLFSYRDAQNLTEHSGIIAIDFDADIDETIDRYVLEGDQYTYAVHQSIGGDGLVVYVKIESDKHLEAFLALEQYYANTYKLTADKSCKDVNRLRYISWDNDLFLNDKAKLFKKYLPKAKQQPTGKIYTQTKNDIEFVIKQVVERGIDLTYDYFNWIEIGFGFAREYGEVGRCYFHDISSVSSKYNYAECDKKYSSLLGKVGGAGGAGRKSGIGTFVWLAAQNGVETKTERTLQAENIAKTRRAMVGKNGGLENIEKAKESAIEYLKQMEGIEGEDVKEVVDKVMQMTTQDVKNANNEGEIFDKVLAYMKALNLKFNEVTRCVEWKGAEIRDMDVNTIYIQCKTALGKRVVKGDIESIINSDVPTPYHPFKEFFKQHTHNKPSGLISELVNCFEYENNDNADYKEKMNEFVIRWLLSVVAQMHGTYSILCGGQGISKTRFFRNLLPDQLQKYFAESTLDNGKDDEILMARKIIVLDDEFAGKSKKEIDKMKAVLSKECFYLRRPYGKISEDVPRFAVLCGTSNNEEILADVANRRIIPCNIKSFDFERYKAIDKTLLWCELYHAYVVIGDGWMLERQDIEDLKRLAATNKQATQEEEAIAAFFRLPEAGDYGAWLTNTEIKNHIETNSRLKLSSTKLGVILKSMGYQKKDVKINGTTLPRYFVVKLEIGVQPYNLQSSINADFS